jgi:hypothetical protein
MYILGVKDNIVPMQRSLALVALSENNRAIKHDGGRRPDLSEES